jgi:tetrahydromethanopterin S-methyltransferase subunit E
VRHRNGELPIEGSTSKFRYGLLPATLLFFAAGIAIAYGLGVMGNVVRDARNGYDTHYLVTAVGFPLALFGMGTCCVLAGWLFVIGQWRTGLVVIGVVLGFASVVVWYVALLS